MKAGRLFIALSCAWGLLAFSSASGAAAAPGDLDLSFGDAGVVNLGPQLGGVAPSSLVIGPGNASFLLEGTISCSAGCSGDLFPSRYRVDGSRDAAFSANARLAALTTSTPYESASVVEVDSQGRALIAALDGGRIEVVRLLASGERDPSFGGAGMVSLDCGCVWEGSELKLAIGADGGIVVGMQSGAILHFFRLQPGGQPDPGFGANGAVGLGVSKGVAVWAQRPDRSLVVADLSCCQERQGQSLRLVRIGKRGGVGERFGSGAERAFSRLQRGLLPANRSYLAGQLLARDGGGLDLLGQTAGGRGFAVSIFARGGLDERFGANGLKLMRWRLEDAVLDPLGRIVAVGAYQRESSSFVVLRLRSDGERDRGFGVVGLQGIEAEAHRRAVAVGPNRRPVIFDFGSNPCRQRCPGSLELFRLLGGPGPGQRSR